MTENGEEGGDVGGKGTERIAMLEAISLVVVLLDRRGGKRGGVRDLYVNGVHIYILHTYIYGERERERKKEREGKREMCVCVCIYVDVRYWSEYLETRCSRDTYLKADLSQGGKSAAVGKVGGQIVRELVVPQVKVGKGCVSEGNE